MIQVKEVLEYLEGNHYTTEYAGDREQSVNGYCQLEHLRAGSITWIKKADSNCLYDFSSLSGGVVVTDQMINYRGDNIGVIITPTPKAVFFSVLNRFFSDGDTGTDIGSNTVIGDLVKIGENVTIGNNCSITGEVLIGNGTKISDNVVIKNRVSIGENCCIQAMTVIGEDGFGYFETADHTKEMILHHGGVIIGDSVFIGSHTNIARGTMGDTVIGDGVKIAPSTHIGHNNYIESNATVICSQLYGSVHVGENAYIVGSIVKNQCSVGADTVIGIGTMVSRDIAPNKVAVGIPARIIRERNK